MNPALHILLYGLGLMVFGGGTVFLLLTAGERVGRWIREEINRIDDKDDNP